MIPRSLRAAPIRRPVFQQRPTSALLLYRPLHYQNGLLQVHRVKFKKRPWMRRFWFNFALYFLAITAWDRIVWKPLTAFLADEEEEDEEAEAIDPLQNDHDVRLLQGHDDDDEDVEDFEDAEGVEEEDLTLFIPLAIPRPCVGRSYSPDDPELKQLTKLLKDKDLAKSLGRELSDMVLESATKDSKMMGLIGSSISIHQTMFFPLSLNMSRIEYVNLGLEIDDDGGVASVIRMMPFEEGKRFRNILVPEKLFLALVGASKLFLRLKTAKLTSFFGSPQGETEHLQDVSSPSGLRDTDSRLSLPEVPKDYRPGSLQESIPKVENPPQLRSEQSPFQNIIHSIPKPDPDFVAAAKVFSALYKRLGNVGLQSSPHYVVVEGLVALKGTKGQCTIYIKGAYDTSERQWIGFDASVKDLSASIT
ncbi:hypothetical protein LOZ58_002571 [Ophidiomyces ophidiicola]|nr:hypothetical protein LOZ58_002571 [Ophidiomyces ophidiicola]